MLSIGNDIVDLEAETVPLHARYRERVFTSRERQYIGSDHKRLWLVWAVKEAGYKVIRRLQAESPFSPRCFEYIPDAQLVIFEGTELPCSVVEHDRYIYAISASDSLVLRTAKSNTWLSKVGHNDPSEAVRGLTLRKLVPFYPEGAVLSVSHPGSKIIPSVQKNGEVTEDLLSFSHHGRFVLSSFVPVSGHVDTVVTATSR